MSEFKFRLPLREELTREQRRAIESKEPVFIMGVAGTGKTTVSAFRLKNETSNSILFTYGKLLRLAIEKTLDNSKKQVYNLHRWHFDKTKIYLEQSLSDENIETTIKFYKNNNHFL